MTPICTNAAFVLDQIAQRASRVDQGLDDLGFDLRLLAGVGLLRAVTDACLPDGDWRQGVDLLSRIGGASLSVGRLVEGHANAARLITLYGSPDQRDQYLRDGIILGVWGADGARPLQMTATDADHVMLSGAKNFCSGLGLVDVAVLTASGPDGPQLLLACVTDTARQNPAVWQVSGMRATASGEYDMDDLTAVRLGKPGDQVIEPHFEGGIWRYLALHSGALQSLARLAGDRLRHGGATDLQKARLARLTIAAGTAGLWASHAARAAEETPADATAIPTVLLAREAIERACQDGVALAERLFGTVAFRYGSQVDLIRRDLAFFLRQADLDGKLLRAADGLLARPAPDAA